MISRRNFFATGAACFAAVVTAPVVFSQESSSSAAQNRQRRMRALPEWKNEHFYKNNDGKKVFDEDKARDAIISLCEYYRYPVYKGLREKLWVSDYGLGNYVEVGLAAVGFVNKLDGEYSFMLQDLFLLPNQMLPEHWHVATTEAERKTKGPQKDEGWLIRHGRSYVIGEGEPNLPPEVVVPKSHGEVTVNHCTIADPGDYVPLAKRGTRHWQFAGKQGVILTEVANYHDNSSVRHTNKTANDHFLSGIK
ncbi:MAG: hypothetical protein LBQ66_03410 [Planctomycetaceae bacterium]|jgi:D-lyxose ketol-isomerase|nr:hypothetical protein [Planctomycetaceae bacterium]